MALQRTLAWCSKQLVTLAPAMVKRARFHGYARDGVNLAREPELSVVPFLLPPSSTFVDVGANLGEYVYVVEHHRPDVRTVAFEPNPELARGLARLFPKVRVETYALSDRKAVADFKVPYLRGREVNTRGSLETGYKEPGEERTRTLRVHLTTLDDWCLENEHAPIGLVKIDVEGHEWTTLAGAARMIASERPVLLVEIESRHHEGSPIWPMIEEFARPHSMTVFCMDALARTFFEMVGPAQIRQDMRDHKTRAYLNSFFFIPNERVDGVCDEVERRLGYRSVRA